MDRGWRPVASGGAVTLLSRQGGAGNASASVAEPDRDRPYFCSGWDRLRRTFGPYASLWVFGIGRLTLDLRSTRATPIVLWVDGRREHGASVNGRARIEVDLAEQRWHSVLFELPGRFEVGSPPGVQLALISFRRE
jgi:hypothetical protein